MVVKKYILHCSNCSEQSDGKKRWVEAEREYVFYITNADDYKGFDLPVI